MKPLLPFLLLTAVALADSKTEADLRQRLAVAEAKLQAAQASATVLEQTGKKIEAGTVSVKAASKTVVASTDNAANRAAISAAATQSTIEENGRIARQQAEEARRQAEEALMLARLQAEQAKEATQKNFYELLGVILVVLTGLVTARVQARSIGKKQEAKLEQIHTLVNSKMTEQMENEMTALRGTAAALEKVIALRREAGTLPTSETLTNIEDTKHKIAALASQLADRAEVTNTAAKNMENDE